MSPAKYQGSAERRRTQRIPARVRCWITGTQSTLYTQTHNLSRGGLSVLGPTPFKEGDEVSVRILGAGHRNVLVARSRVVWCQTEAGQTPKGMGAEFLEILDGESLLDQLLKKPGDESP